MMECIWASWRISSRSLIKLSLCSFVLHVDGFDYFSVGRVSVINQYKTREHKINKGKELANEGQGQSRLALSVFESVDVYNCEPVLLRARTFVLVFLSVCMRP